MRASRCREIVEKNIYFVKSNQHITPAELTKKLKDAGLFPVTEKELSTLLNHPEYITQENYDDCQPLNTNLSKNNPKKLIEGDDADL